MNTVLLQLLAGVCSVILALPPGLCCGLSLPSREVADAVPVQARCCQPASQCDQIPRGNHAPDSKPGPSQGHCCCEREGTLPEKSLPTLVGAALCLPFVAEALAPQPCAVQGLASVTVHFPGPPLHVLQCVWRC